MKSTFCRRAWTMLLAAIPVLGMSAHQAQSQNHKHTHAGPCPDSKQEVLDRCSRLPRMPNEPPRAVKSQRQAAAFAPPLLNSRPSAVAQIYLDFDGETVTEPLWNGGRTIVAAAYDIPDAEITRIFDRVKEDFVPFDVNVTTDVSKYNSAAVGRRMHVIITPTDTAAPTAGGVAIINSFSFTGRTVPCWVFNSSVIGISEATSHEVGHTFGLLHDGRLMPDGSTDEYYDGHGTGATSWAPIMGASYSVNVSQWSKGEYALANNTNEDDVAIIASARNGIGYVPDEAGGTIATAASLTIAGSTVATSGVIHSATDADLYLFTTDGTPLTINASGAAVTPNLDIKLEILNFAGAVVAAAAPDDSLAASITNTLPAGTYFVRVGSSGAPTPPGTGYTTYGSIGSYNLSGSITQNTIPPANDNFIEAEDLPDISGVAVGFNTNATVESGEPTSYNNNPNYFGATVWYRYTAQISGLLTLSTEGSDFNTVVTVYTGTSFANLQRITADDEGGPNGTSVTSFSVNAGSVYYIQVGGLLGAKAAMGNLNLQYFVKPGNDLYAGAIPLVGLSGSVSGLNVGATLQAGEYDASGLFGSTVWYSFVAPGKGTLYLDTLGSDFDTHLSVFTGSSLANLTLVAENDDADQLTSRLNLRTAPGVTYYIKIGGWGPTSGRYLLNHTYTASPGNDDFGSAQVLTGIQGSINGSNVGATTQAGEMTVVNGLNGLFGNTVWYQYTPLFSGKLTIDTIGSEFDTVLAVYTGGNLGGLTRVATNNNYLNGSPGPSRVSFAVTGTTPYYIQVGGYTQVVSGFHAGLVKLNYELAQAPFNELLTPSVRQSIAGSARTWSAIYRDPDGEDNLREVYIAINGSLTMSNALFGYYDAVGNKLWLRNNSHTAWLGGFAPGSANTITNAQGTLNCAATGVTRIGTDLIVTWSFTPSIGFSGLKQVYLRAVDKTDLFCVWADMGNWAILPNGNVPQLGAVTPSSLSSPVGTSRLISSTFTHGSGHAALQGMRLLVGPSVSLANAFGVTYNNVDNKLYVIGDNGTSFLGGFAPGSNNTISNSRGTLDCSLTTVVRSGNNITVNWSLTPRSGLQGQQNLYTWVRDIYGLTAGFTTRAIWNVTANTAPQAVSVSPANSSSLVDSVRSFTATYSDANGVETIQGVRLLVNANTSLANAFCVTYNAEQNKLYVIADDGTTFLGGFAPGSNNVITNSRGSLHCLDTTVSRSGNNLVVNWSVTPHAASVGAKRLYAYVNDRGGRNSGYVNRGTWTIQQSTGPVSAAAEQHSAPELDTTNPSGNSS